MAWNKINNYIYFYHLEKFCVLPDCPENITDVMPTSFSNTNALARTAPVFSYNNSGPRRVTVGFEFHRDMLNDINRNLIFLVQKTENLNVQEVIDNE